MVGRFVDDFFAYDMHVMRLVFADTPLFVHGLCRLKTPVRRSGVTVHFAGYRGRKGKIIAFSQSAGHAS